MDTFLRRTPVAASADELFAWHARPGAFERLTPPWQPVELVASEGVHEGARATIRLGPEPFALTWEAEHHVETPGRAFVDVQRRGPFASWTHAHRAIPDGAGASVLEDEVHYTLPLSALSEPLAGAAVRAQLARMFAYRHRVTSHDLARHSAASLSPLTVAITGASGLVGRALAAFLTTGGHRVVRFVRTRREAASAGTRAVYWNPDAGEVDEAALALAAPDAVVHLAGEPVYGPGWTAAKRRRVWESRTKGTLLIARALARMPRPPDAFLSASATGYYGDRGATRLTEDDAPGAGFLADVCRAWEAASMPAADAGIRTAQLRFGVVLSPAGGLLGRAAPLFRLGLGGTIGRGEAFLPWIALDDALYAVHYALASPRLDGPINVVAPEPVELGAFAETLGRVLRRPAPWHLPRGLVRTLGGPIGSEAALASARVEPARLIGDGFTFAYPELEPALRHVLGHRLDAPLVSPPA